jgi:hypothetical protein
MDARSDRREMERLGVPPPVFYEAAQDWSPLLHAALDHQSPCTEGPAFEQLWKHVLAELSAAGARVGLASYRGWNDGDHDFARAIWCLVAHSRPERVVETGVAHGLTSRVILEGMNRNEQGHLWSVDLPAVDSSLHDEIGMAVPASLRSRWTYVAGTSRQRLPGVLSDVGQLDIFVHDSLHTRRNTGFELRAAWAALRHGGAVVVDDIHRNTAFRALVAETGPPWFTARHALGPGMWGVAVKTAA